MISLGFIFLFCLAASFCFSASEMAFVSANQIKIRELSDGGNAGAKSVLRLLDFPQEFLTIFLVGNNIVTIVATAILTYFFEMRHITNEWLVTLIMTPLLIILCETVPKDYARQGAHQFLITYAAPLGWLLKIFKWPVKMILHAVDFFLGPLGTTLERSIFVSEKEFRLLIEESAMSGVLARHEKQLIDTIMDFERIQVSSVMVPVERADKVDITDPIGKVKETARKTNARMFLVSEDIPTLIVGMIYVFDLLFEEDDKAPLKKYLRSPIFLSKNTSIEKAFLTLQEKRQSFAVVTDEDAEVVGVVAIEKLFSPVV